jgi:hypothetical protein
MSATRPFPDTALLPGTWSGIQRQLERCLALGAAGTLPGTLLIVGEEALGREALALELAAGLVCHNKPLTRCACQSCERVRRGAHPDVVVVDVLPGKTEISIGQVREVVETLPQRPYEGSRRVFVLASCHTPPLNLEAASALLKSLEEPPPHVCLILLAANPARVLPTVVSRAVQLRVAPPTPEELDEALAATLSTGREQVVSLLRACQGDPRLAMEVGAGEPEALLAGLRELAESTLQGDGLAMLRLAASIKGLSRGVPLTVAALLSLAREAGPDAAEAPLDAAAALLLASRRQESLHTDLEAAMAGVLATFARSVG